MKREMLVMWLRFLRFWGKFFKTRDVLTQEQKMGLRIFERAISVKDAEIFFSPLSDTIYIEVEEIYLILDNSGLQVINGKFQYDIHYNDRPFSALKNRVFNVLESRRVKIEKRIKFKSDHTLHSILDEVDHIREVHNRDKEE